MHDDDNRFQRFVPLLRRVIILLAVLAATPVVLWMITTFVRAYVGPPENPRTASDCRYHADGIRHCRGKHAELRSGSCLTGAEQDCRRLRVDNRRHSDDVGPARCGFAERLTARGAAVRRRRGCPCQHLDYGNCFDTAAVTSSCGFRDADKFDGRDDADRRRPSDSATAAGEYRLG